MNFKRHNVKRRQRKWDKLAEASWGRVKKHVKERRYLKRNGGV